MIKGISLGNYSCYNCGKEFWTLGGLRKHSEKFQCPRITPEMIKAAQEPYRRIIIEIHDVVPVIDKDRFMESRRFEIRNSADLQKAEAKMIMEIKEMLKKNFNEYYTTTELTK